MDCRIKIQPEEILTHFEMNENLFDIVRFCLIPHRFLLPDLLVWWTR